MILASYQWGPATANGVVLLTEMYVIYMVTNVWHGIFAPNSLFQNGSTWITLRQSVSLSVTCFGSQPLNDNCYHLRIGNNRATAYTGSIYYTQILWIYITGLYIQKAYTSLGTSSMQILLLSAHACMHFAWELQLDTKCVHLVYIWWQEVPKLVYAFWTCKPVICRT